MRGVHVRFTTSLTYTRQTDAYYTQESFEALQTVDDIPCLRDIDVPRNRYVCARNNGGRRRERQGVSDAILPPFAYDSSSSTSSSSPREGFYPTPYPLQPSPSHTHVAPAAPLPSGFVLTDRRLAPLEYLQNISPRARDPIDDEALRQFQAISI